MLNSEEKNIPTLVLSEKKILNETKNHNPPQNYILDLMDLCFAEMK
jgi:hypothetical protein